MSSNTIDQGQKITLYKQALCDQYCHRPLWTFTEDSGNLHERIILVANILSQPEKDAAVISYKMKTEKCFQEKSPLTPLMQKVFSQFEAIRENFFLFEANTFDMFHAFLLMKLLDRKFLSEKGKDPIILNDTSSSNTYEDFAKNMTKVISLALWGLLGSFLSKSKRSLIETQKQIKLILEQLEIMDRFLLEERKEDLPQKSWGRQLHALISLLNLCVRDTSLLPLLVQVSTPSCKIYDPSFNFKSKQTQLLQTLADCLNIYIEEQECQLSLRGVKLGIEQKILIENCEELKNKVLPQIFILISLLDDSRLNASKTEFKTATTAELMNILELRIQIEKSTKELEEMYSRIDIVFREMEKGREEDCPSWAAVVYPLARFTSCSMQTFIFSFFTTLQGQYSFQVRIEKCISLCTIYPIQHCLVSKLDLLQTTNLSLINELKESLETNAFEKLLENHATCFELIRTFVVLGDAPLSLFNGVKITLKESLEVFETLMQERGSLMKEFINALDELKQPQLLRFLLTPCGTLNVFKKTDFHFLTTHLRETMGMISFEPFDLESTPDPEILLSLKSKNETLEKFQQKKAEIASDYKYSDIQQLNILALELFNIREELEKIHNFYYNFKKFFESQTTAEKWMQDLMARAARNYSSLIIFDQGNKAFFAYCAEVFFDSLTPQKKPITTPLKKIAAARVPSPIEEIKTESVAASAPQIKRVKDHKRDLESLCMKLKSYSLPRSEVSTDFVLGHDAIQNIHCYMLQIENLFSAFEEFPYQTAQALFSKLSNLIEQAGNFVAAAKNVQGAINHKHDLLDDLSALGVTIAPIVHILNGWSSTKYHYSESDLSTETLSMLKDLKSSSVQTLTAKKRLEGMMNDAYAFTSGLLNSVAHVELQDSLYETPHVTTLSQAIMPYLTIDPLLDEVNILVTRTQMSFSVDRAAYIAQVSDDEDYDDKRMRMQLISSGCRIIKESLFSLSDLAKPVSSGISYTIAESLLLNAALILERTGFITLARLNRAGKDDRHIVFSKSEHSHDSRELRSNHDLEKIFGELNLKVIEERRDIIAFFGNTVGGATRYLGQYKMGAAILLEEILFLNVIRKALQEGGLFKEEEHRRLKELFSSSESATLENVDIKLSQLMDIVNDKVARALELTATLLKHNLSIS